MYRDGQLGKWKVETIDIYIDALVEKALIGYSENGMATKLVGSSIAIAVAVLNLVRKVIGYTGTILLNNGTQTLKYAWDLILARFQAKNAHQKEMGYFIWLFGYLLFLV